MICSDGGYCVKHLYGVSRFKRAQFTITAVLPATQKSRSAALADLRSLEAKLLEKQGSIRAFEREYKQVSRVPCPPCVSKSPCLAFKGKKASELMLTSDVATVRKNIRRHAAFKRCCVLRCGDVCPTEH